MKMTSIIIYYGYTYFGLPDIDEKKVGYFYSYAKVDDSDEKIDDSDKTSEASSRSQFQKSVPVASSSSQFQEPATSSQFQ
jgi:hypothetical protein